MNRATPAPEEVKAEIQTVQEVPPVAQEPIPTNAFEESTLVEPQIAVPVESHDVPAENLELTATAEVPESAPVAPEFASKMQDTDRVAECESEPMPLNVMSGVSETEPLAPEVQTLSTDEIPPSVPEAVPSDIEAVPLQARNETPELKDLLLGLETVLASVDSTLPPAHEREQQQGESEPEPLDAEAVLEIDSPAAAAVPPSDWPIWKPPLTDEASPVPAGVVQLDLTAQEVSAPHRPRAFALAREAAAQLKSKGTIAIEAVRQRIRKDERLFWGAAVAAGALAVSALLLGAGFHRFSPLPSRFSPEEGAAEPVTISSDSASARSNEKAASPERVTNASELLKPASIRKPVSSSDADLIAPDTVIHYMKREPAAPRKPARTAKPHSPSRHHSDSDMIAEDTVTHYDRNTGTATQGQKKQR